MGNNLHQYSQHVFIYLALVTHIAAGLELEIFCSSPVLGRYGEELTLSCEFPSDAIYIYWFEEHESVEPVIRRQEGKKDGRGLESGEYDITDKGDLRINVANFSNEQTYTVRAFNKASIQGTYTISVIIQGPASIGPTNTTQDRPTTVEGLTPATEESDNSQMSTEETVPNATAADDQTAIHHSDEATDSDDPTTSITGTTHQAIMTQDMTPMTQIKGLTTTTEASDCPTDAPPDNKCIALIVSLTVAVIIIVAMIAVVFRCWCKNKSRRENNDGVAGSNNATSKQDHEMTPIGDDGVEPSESEPLTSETSAPSPSPGVRVPESL